MILDAYAYNAASPVSPSSAGNTAFMTIGIAGIVLLIVGLLVYFIPSIVAMKKNHPQKVAILLLNIFLGWTFIGWVGSLVWAFIKPQSNNSNKIE